MKNLNSPRFWDKQFKKEWKAIKTNDILRPRDGYRFDALRFMSISNNIPMGGKFLDIGCGMGNFCRYLKARNPRLEIHGLDYSKFAIKKAIKMDSRLNFIVGDTMKLPFEDNSFDTISAQEIIEHLEDVDQFLLEIRRVLKPNGRLFITTPFRKGNVLSSIEHLKEYTPAELVDLLRGYFRENKLIMLSCVPYDFEEEKIYLPNWYLIGSKI